MRADGSHDQVDFFLGIGTMGADVRYYSGRNAGDEAPSGCWMHFGQEGWNLDSVLQVSRNDIEARPIELSKLKTKGWGYACSPEGGYPYEADKDLWGELQAQIIYGYVDLDDSDDNGADVRPKDVESLIGRVGRHWETEGGDENRRRTHAGFDPVFGMNSMGSPRSSSPHSPATYRLRPTSIPHSVKRTSAWFTRPARRWPSRSLPATARPSTATVTNRCSGRFKYLF